MVNIRWHDTLFARLFVLLWATLLLSHAVAFVVVTEVAMPLYASPVSAPWSDRPRPQIIFPSLPPAGAGEHVDSPAVHPMPGLPLPLLLLDYAIRLLVMGLGAWWGSRWLTQPVSRLVQAAHQMSTALEQGQQPTPMDERQGTIEAQQAARVFNRLSMDLYKAFRSRELLFATVSHDLRTPMTRIRLRLESQPGPLEVAQCINDIAQMDELVRSALALARLQAQALQPTRIDAVIQAVVDDYEERGAQVHWPGSADAPALTALADPLALRRVLDNVVQNSLRLATELQIALYCTLDQNSVVITLDDNGPGIDEAQLVRVFEPGVRATNAQSDHHGHGLGLYIAQDLMRRQGGSIALSNRPEGGLRVVIQLKKNSA